MSIPAVCTLLMVDVSKSRAVPPMPFNPFQTGRLQMTGVITRLSWDCCYLPDTRSKPFQFGAARLHVSSVMMQFNSIDSQFYSLYRLRLQSPAFFLCLRKISNIWFSKRVLLLCRMQIGLARRGTASRWVVIYHDFSNWKHKWLVSLRAGDGDDCDDDVMTGGVSGSCRRTSVISDRSRANVTTGIAKLRHLWRPVTDEALARSLCCRTAFHSVESTPLSRHCTND